jgi:ketosteroid isomerase-like protein
MSQENVETFRRGADAYNRGDVEALLELVHPDVEWHPLLPVLLGGKTTVYRGHEGVREIIRELDEAFVEIQNELLEVRDLGEQVLGIGRLWGRGRESGVETETEVVWLAEFRDGKGVRMREYLDPKEALEAAGLSE